MKILKIQKNKLYLDNLEIIDVNKDILFEFKLNENQDITLIYKEIVFASALNKAIYLVNIKARSEFEIRQKLLLKYTDKDTITKVIKRLKDLYLLDDFNYSCVYINNNISKGENYLKRNLLLKGISMKIIDKALIYIKDSEDFYEIQLEKILSFIRKNTKLSNDKLIARLINKGYTYSLIMKALKMEGKSVYISYE